MQRQAADRNLFQHRWIDPGQRDGQPDRDRGQWIAGAVLVLIGVAAGATVTGLLRGHRSKAEVEAATPVAPRSGTILQATGYVTSRHAAIVSAQIPGKLTEVLADEGAHVKAGQVLARLESTAQIASLAQSRAQLQAARALLVQSKAQLRQNYRDLVRNEDLVARHLVSIQALETARTLVETQVSQVESQRRQVDMAQANVKSAEVALDYTTVRAPFSGVIIAQPAQVGEFTQPMQPGGDPKLSGVATIVDMDSLVIEVDVNDAYINRVQPDQPAEAVPDAHPEWTIPAHVISTFPTADRNKPSFKARLAIDQKDPRVLPNMAVHVSFLDQVPKSGTPRAPSEGNESVPKVVFVPRRGS